MDMDQTDQPVKIVYVDRKPDPLSATRMIELSRRWNSEKLISMSDSMKLGYDHLHEYIGFVIANHKGLATRDSAVSFIALQHGRMRHSTFGWKMNAVRSFFRWCTQRDLIDERQDPFRNVPSPKAPPRPPPSEDRIITPEQYQKLRHHAAGRIAEWPIMLAWNTGMAMIDCCTLEWQHVNMDEHYIQRARSKTGSWSTIPYPQDGELDWALREKLKIARHVGKAGPGDLVSPEHREASAVRGAFELVRNEAELHDITFHSFRYTFASMLMASGMSQIQASKVTGHMSPDMLNHYTILKSDDLRAPIERAKQLAGRDQEVAASTKQPEPPVGSRAQGWGFQPGKRYQIKFEKQPRLPDGKRILLVMIPDDQSGAVANAWPVDLDGNRLLGDETIMVRYCDCRKWRELD